MLGRMFIKSSHGGFCDWEWEWDDIGMIQDHAFFLLLLLLFLLGFSLVDGMLIKVILSIAQM